MSPIIQVLSQGLAATGLDVVTRIFPRKANNVSSPLYCSKNHCLKRLARELQQIIDGSPLNPVLLLNRSTRPTTELPDKKRKLTELTYLANSQLEESPVLQSAWTTHTRYHLVGSKSIELDEAYSIVKAESSAMVQLTDQALAWFLLSHCKGKDLYSKSGQDTLAIREELLSELHRAQEAGINIHASITKTHVGRADLCSRIADHPEIEDYVLALQSHDEHQVLLLRQNIRDLRNVYIALYDHVKAVVD